MNFLQHLGEIQRLIVSIYGELGAETPDINGTKGKLRFLSEEVDYLYQTIVKMDEEIEKKSAGVETEEASEDAKKEKDLD